MEGGEAGGEAVAAAAAALTIEFGDHCYGHHTVIGERPSGGGQASADGYLPIFTGRPSDVDKYGMIANVQSTFKNKKEL